MADYREVNEMPKCGNVWETYPVGWNPRGAA